MLRKRYKDWRLGFLHEYMANADMRVGRVTKIVDKLKSGLDRVNPQISIMGQQGWECTVNRSGYLCLMEDPFDADEGVLGVGKKYKM